MIRPTFLQIAASNNNLSHVVPQALANHSSAATTYQYLSTAWYSEQLDSLIQEFQNLFESLFIRDIEMFANSMGMEPADIVKRQGLAEETGLGFVCSAVRSTQLKEKVEIECVEVERCASCTYRMFVPTDDALQALWLTNRSLLDQAKAFRAQNPDRWVAIWLPYLALTQAVLMKLENTRYRAKLAVAKKSVERKLAASTLGLVQLW